MLADLNLPDDLKNLSDAQLLSLADEIRGEIVSAVGKNGGHLASNLGVVELAIALHRSFESPKDAIIWDVSHQCYAHKLLTGRYKDFSSIRTFNGISGFTNHKESIHDFFDCGHASTSVSSALGLAMARHLQNDGGRVIAVLGDGALTGGMTYEALLHAGEIGRNIIVVLNDNQMSINKTTGSFSKYLSRLRLLPRYQSVRNRIDWVILRIPFINKLLAKAIFAFKRMCKASFYKTNLFAELDFEYVGPIDGHNFQELEDVFSHIKRVQRPIVVHVMTQKGKGYSPAEANPALFHGVSPFSLLDGVVEHKRNNSFTSVFAKKLISMASVDSKIVAITAAMRQGTGLEAFAERFPNRFFDVGIAEEHGVTFAAGLAVGGLKPVVAIYSTFFQRSIDQVIHDVALQNARVIFALDRSGAVPDDGPTHQGIFDIALLRSIPGITILAPASEAEMELCLEWAASSDTSTVLRYPKTDCPAEVPGFSRPMERGRGVMAIESKNAETLLVCTGGIFAEVREASNILLRNGVPNDVYNLRFLTPVDEEYFINIVSRYKAVVFVEDGIKQGGICE
ncbi:MAG: 1-deoxy-D-xylulose-5-phosphate synthase, partial [Spirochaetaceae bacterium]|nr:1-deoxy-D-xylulose-5-phosphate synthase [Spirochaetaceae bacterium]